MVELQNSIVRVKSFYFETGLIFDESLEFKEFAWGFVFAFEKVDLTPSGVIVD